jgi:hypothetical protein
MIHAPNEAKFLSLLNKVVAETNAAIGAPVLAVDWKEIPVLSVDELRTLGEQRRGWYTASQAFEAVHQHRIPSQGHAIRLGKQLLTSGRPVRWVGAQRLYWIAPEGVRPPEQIGVS